MEKKPSLNIRTIGHVDHGRADLSRTIENALKEHKVVIINEPHYDIEINGVKYVEREQQRRRHDVSLSMAALLAIGGLMGNINSYNRPRPQVNIVSEFKLIQDKKSKLCRNDRDWVVYQFNQLYKVVPSPTPEV